MALAVLLVETLALGLRGQAGDSPFGQAALHSLQNLWHLQGNGDELNQCPPDIGLILQQSGCFLSLWQRGDEKE